MPETPKKLENKHGRKPNELCVDDFCRLKLLQFRPKIYTRRPRVEILDDLMQEIGLFYIKVYHQEFVRHVPKKFDDFRNFTNVV